MSSTDSKVNDENIVFNNFINEDVETETKPREEVSKEIEDRENFIDSAIKIATESGSTDKDTKKKAVEKTAPVEEKTKEAKGDENNAESEVVDAIENTALAEIEVDVSEPKQKKAKLSEKKESAEKKTNEPNSDVLTFNKKKRNRKVLSCQKCRKDKQACSRVYPCTRCAKKDFECKFIDNITKEEFYPKADDLPKANPSASKKQKTEQKEETAETKEEKKPEGADIEKETAETKEEKKPEGADIEKETAEAVLAASAAVEAEKEEAKPVEEVKEEDDKDQIDAELKKE